MQHPISFRLEASAAGITVSAAATVAPEALLSLLGSDGAVSDPLLAGSFLEKVLPSWAQASTQELIQAHQRLSAGAYAAVRLAEDVASGDSTLRGGR